MFEKEAEEMAEERWNNWAVKDWNDLQEGKRLFIQAFLAGLKAGRPQWHDLRKDPTDLPKFEGDYMCALLNSTHSSFILSLAIEDGLKYWQDCESTDWTNEVIAWCELPTFDKENRNG